MMLATITLWFKYGLFFLLLVVKLADFVVPSIVGIRTTCDSHIKCVCQNCDLGFLVHND